MEEYKIMFDDIINKEEKEEIMDSDKVRIDLGEIYLGEENTIANRTIDALQERVEQLEDENMELYNDCMALSAQFYATKYILGHYDDADIPSEDWDNLFALIQECNSKGDIQDIIDAQLDSEVE